MYRMQALVRLKMLVGAGLRLCVLWEHGQGCVSPSKGCIVGRLAWRVCALWMCVCAWCVFIAPAVSQPHC
jgi:hypothetical protein